MTALIAGFLLVAYLLAPGAIYRLIFSFFISAKRFQRTRTEEVVFSVLATLVPFVAAWLLLLHTPLGRYPAFAHGGSKSAAYRTVLASILPGSDTPDHTVPGAFLRSFAEQARFIAWLWLFCAIEGWVGSTVVRHYGEYPPDSLLKRICDKTLLRHVSEWELLFTTLALPRNEKYRNVEIDALTTMDVLYRGQLDDWFVDIDGQLAGIYLIHASRFARDLLDHDREAGTELPIESYWRPIPGAQLYLVAGTIANYNIRYVRPVLGKEQLSDELLGEHVVITPMPVEDTED